MTETRPRPRPLSLWHDQGPAPVTRPALTGVVEADVAIVGGGYTGLWTAYYLAKLRPDLSVAVVEGRFCGYGASGRNGGWVSSKFPGSRAAMSREHGREGVIAYQRAMFDSIDQIGKAAAAEGIDCHYRKGGMLLYATRPAHLPRLRHHLREMRAWGYGDHDVAWLDRDAALERAALAGTEGAIYTPHCASIHPWRLVTGLADAVERRGVTIYENSPARALNQGLVVTDQGAVRARHVLRCTEAFTPRLPGQGRVIAPVYSLMVATQPMPDAWWDEVGLREGETFSDERHLIVYGQRTADGRFAFGGRGAPYHFGSSVKSDWDVDDRTHRMVEDVLRELFPQLGEARFTHRWGGAVAVPRDWRVSVDLDPSTGLGHAGGYVGQGVTGSFLAGRTLADMVAGVDNERTRLPFVGHKWRRWEPEPLRWLGINLGRSLAPMADAAEARTGRPSRVLGGALRRLTNG